MRVIASVSCPLDSLSLDFLNGPMQDVEIRTRVKGATLSKYTKPLDLPVTGGRGQDVIESTWKLVFRPAT